MIDSYIKQKYMWNEEAFKLGWAYFLRQEKAGATPIEYIGILTHVNERELEFSAVVHQEKLNPGQDGLASLVLKISYQDIPDWEIRILV